MVSFADGRRKGGRTGCYDEEDCRGEKEEGSAMNRAESHRAESF